MDGWRASPSILSWFFFSSYFFFSMTYCIVNGIDNTFQSCSRYVVHPSYPYCYNISTLQTLQPTKPKRSDPIRSDSDRADSFSPYKHEQKVNNFSNKIVVCERSERLLFSFFSFWSQLWCWIWKYTINMIPNPASALWKPPKNKCYNLQMKRYYGYY